MAGNTKRRRGQLMGIIILLVDLYWMYIARGNTTALGLGVIILIADLLWLFFDM